jgi:hypothetical protein
MPFGPYDTKIKPKTAQNVQGHSPNNPNFPSRNRKPLPTLLDPKNTASWGRAERQMTMRKVCCGPRKAAAGEGRKPEIRKEHAPPGREDKGEGIGVGGIRPLHYYPLYFYSNALKI